MNKIFLFLFSVVVLAQTPVLTPASALSVQETETPLNYNTFLLSVMGASESIVGFNNSIAPTAVLCKEIPRPEKVESRVKVEGEQKSSSVDEANFNFRSDGNPNKSKILSQTCTTDQFEILEKCYPPLADKIKRREISFNDIQKMPNEGFRIRGYGKSIENSRSWEFHHENRAKQDIGVTVFDGYNFGKGTVSASELMFFPRKQIQHYTKSDSAIEVTLSNGEKMKFNSKTGAVESGVVTESRYAKGSKPKFTYEGTGVMIQMEGREGNGRSFVETAKNAVITKKGFKPCIVSASELWPNRNSERANNFRFATDESLDAWLKQSKCGFSL
tara:strand:- start:50977 stop:51966 length:990 start_codon:yes stop_codon:yes gene_type:complete